MRSTARLVTIAVTACLVTPMAVPGPLAGGAESPPNIVLLVVDNMGRESVGHYGGKLFSTPRIDAIGSEGVVFERCYIGTPLCSPARAGLMTGRYPHWAGVFGQPDPRKPKEGGLDLREVTLAQTLKAAGYHTGLFGKWNLGYDEIYLPTRRGFDRYYGINAGHADYYTHIYDKDGKKYFYSDTEPIDPVGYVDNLCVDEALKWLRHVGRNDRPFFLEVAFFTPHGPYQSPPGYPAEGDVDAVYGYMIDNLDKNVGRIIDGLKEVGVADDTLIVFLSDQGASSKNPYRRDLTEGGLKVVCYAKWPGHTAAGARVATPFISYDWFTTLTEIGGGAIPTDRVIVGKNIGRLLRGDGPSPHETFYWTYKDEDAVLHDDWKLHLKNDGVQGLYYLSDDAEAKNDLAGRYPERVERLRKMIETHKAAGSR
ncbi:MAG: sulfatase-like hydrolase/transferase [Planctomycetota bacterium]|jgi:arylsulfatase A-like enzyme